MTTACWRAPWEGDTSDHKPHASCAPPAHPNFDLKAVIRAALDEDLGDSGDLTSLATVPTKTQAIGHFVAKANGVVAGLAVVDMVFDMVDASLSLSWTATDGGHVCSGDFIGTVKGNAISILTAERVALNLLQRMSGIATATAAMVAAAKGFPARILETRKTVPGLRLLDKWAVLIGGGDNHRMGLYDMILIKDNHIAAAGGISAAVRSAEDFLRDRELELPIEVEVASLLEVQEVLSLLNGAPKCMVTRIMLDNMAIVDPAAQGGIDASMIRDAVELIDGRVETEASGNVTLATVRTLASTGVSFISCGSLTHSVTALDVSLKFEARGDT